MTIAKLKRETNAESPGAEGPGAKGPGAKRSGLLAVLGPGLITGASDDDPSGIATYSQAGAQFGYGLTWTMLFTYPLMTAVQIISGQMGRTTGCGIAGNLRLHAPSWLLHAIVILLVVANTINIGADLGAMAESTRLITGGPQFLYVLIFALLCALLQVFMRYARYVTMLKWLTLALLAYVVTAFVVHVPWGEALKSFVIPQLQWDKDYLTTVVAVFGTTISPYLFFWQASQEAEDVRETPERKALKKAPEQGPDAIERIQLDTIAGMAISNLIALAIIVTAAATLHTHGVTDIRTSAQAAEALRPIAGPLAEALFALGVVGTGLLSVPVLAGSSAYAIGEARQWKTGLARRPLQAKRFYAVICLATLVGMLMNFTPIDPIRALYWSAVINGVVATPVMAIMMWMAAAPKVMGEFVIGGWIKGLGWAATGIMGLSVIAMLAAMY